MPDDLDPDASTSAPAVDPVDRAGSGGSTEAPRTNPVPLLIAAGVALVLIIGIVAVFASGSDDGDSESAEGVVVDGAEPPADVTEVSPVPDVEFVYFDDTTGTFDDFAGEPVVLNFFASWCAPCIDEMPDLQAVSEEYDGEVTFVGMNTQDDKPAGERIAEETGVDYTLARDPSGAVLEAFEGLAMPTTVFISADGEVVRLHSGKITADNLRQVIEQDLLA